MNSNNGNVPINTKPSCGSVAPQLLIKPVNCPVSSAQLLWIWLGRHYLMLMWPLWGGCDVDPCPRWLWPSQGLKPSPPYPVSFCRLPFPCIFVVFQQRNVQLRSKLVKSHMNSDKMSFMDRCLPGTEQVSCRQPPEKYTNTLCFVLV